MDTTHILFICGGSFAGIEDIIQRRIGTQRIGHERQLGHVSQVSEDQDSELLSLVTPQDVLSFGLIPELIGRLPIMTPCCR